jgi:hypothetical protein
MGGFGTQRARRWLLLVAAACLAIPITLTDAISEPDGTVDAIATGQITIDLFADEALIVGGYAGLLAIGGDVHWRNRSGETRTVTSPDGLFDSGPIPDGGSFHASLPVPGTYEWSSEFGEGVITVEADFTGEDDGERALDHVPDVAPPPRDPDDIGLHPDLLVDLSRTVAIIGFTETATVKEARQALGTSWDIVGGLPEFGLVYARVWTTSRPTNFVVLDSRVAQLESHAAVEFVSYDFPFEATIVAPPSSDAAETRSYWEPPQLAAVGAGDNWGLELARVPQAWNLRDATRLGGGQDRGAIVALDSGFEDHDDLSRLQRLQYCTSGLWELLVGNKCTTLVPNDHGNQVAGVIGADFDDGGITGVDPYSRLYGLPWIYGEARSAALDGDPRTSMQLLLRALRDGQLTGVNVVNMSLSLSLPTAADWWAKHAEERCGPGPDDDAGATGICYPDTQDTYIAKWKASGEASRRVFESFVKELPDPPLFVVATANDSLFYCPEMTTPLCELGTGHAVDKRFMGRQWAAANWNDAVGPNPIITVESIGELVSLSPRVGAPSLERSGFSNVGGDVSASGLTTSTVTSRGHINKDGVRDYYCLTPGQSGGANGYCFGVGTSLAAPLVAGVAGLLAAWDPTLTAAQLRERLITWSIADTTDGAAPRVDAYASLMSLPSVAKAMVDVNDPSQDGNRRVAYEADGSGVADEVVATRPGFFTEPDGDIDLRDFRRFRDAWLVRCQISPEPGCPPSDEIALDGALDHPKRDLNADGCVLLAVPAENQACPSELTFPRFDFNGDGTISRNDVSLMPLELVNPATNQWLPVATPAEGTVMTDLEVMMSQWEAGAPGSFGVVAADLERLMYSGDLVLVEDALAAAGADAVTVALVEHATDQVVGGYNVVLDNTDDGVLTIPAGTSHRLEVEATGPSYSCTHTIGPFSVRAGEDRVVDLSAALSVDVDPDALRPDESADVTVTAASCNGDVEGLSVALALDPLGAGSAELDAAAVTLDADGAGSTTVSAGTLRNSYEITATADVPIGPIDTSTRSASTSFTVSEAYELELAAVDDAPSGYFALDEWLALGVPVGPSVNGDGDIGFGALIDNADRYQVYVAEPGDDPAVPAEADVVSGTVIPVDARVTGEPELNDGGETVFTTVRSDGGGVRTEVFLSDGAGVVTELATGLNTIGATTEPYSEVERPTINENGRAIFVTTDQSGAQRLAERQGAIVVVGLETFGARPQLADDGTSAVQATVSRDCDDYPGVCIPPNTQILDPIILAGPDVQPTRVAIAEGRVDGFGALSDPDISPPGDVIAFVGDRNDTAGLFIAVRRPDGSWQDPIAVEGPAAPGDLVDVVRDRPTVVQIEGGSAGPAGDRVLITVKGNESGAAGPAAQGVFVVPIDLFATGDAVTPFAPIVDRPRLVAQIGDPVGGKTIDRIELSDSLALATAPSFDDDHWVAFYAEATDGSNMHVRAKALAPPEVAVVPGGPGTGLAVIRRSAPAGAIVHPAVGPHPQDAVPARAVPRQIDPADVEVAPGPHIAAVTVDDDTPTAREPARIVNRSRALDGTPAWGVADEAISRPEVLLNPELMAPDGELFVTYPRTGTKALQVGAPLSSGEFANSVRFQVTVQLGENRPPIGEILDAPYLVAPGQSVRVSATGTDPDGDRLSYSWDLDDDGEFDDGTFASMLLSADEVQTVVCGGACVLEQPNSIKVRILDDRGLDVVVQSALTVSGFGDILLRLDPELIQANPGSSARSYAFVDKPVGDPSVPVQMSIEGAPAGWNVSVTNEVGSGGAALVTARVPDEELEGSFSFDVVATTGDVERRATLTVVTLFGLIPECTATVEGTVTDELGNPVANAEFDPSMQFAPTVTTAADGTFSFDSILPRGASIERFFWTVTGPGDPLLVRLTGGPHYARCDETTTVNPVMELVPDASGLTMRAVEGIENPVQPTRPLATDVPMAGVTFTIRYRPERFDIVEQQVTAGDGVALFQDLPTSNSSGNSLSYRISAFKEGYWSITRSVNLTSLDEDQLIDAGDFPLIPACSGRVSTARVVDQFGDPVSDSQVWITSPRVGDVLFTDADGIVTFDEEVFLATYNRSRLVTIRANAPSEWETTDFDVESKRLGSCGEVLGQYELEVERPEPEIDYFGTLVGTVTDIDTGAPIEGASVSGGVGVNSFSTSTDEFGNWSAEVFTGTDPATVRHYSVNVSEWTVYWPEFGSAEVPADTEVRVDTQLTAREFVELTGNVTDAETGEPIEGAYVVTSKTGRSGGGAVIDFTDATGDYTLPELELAQGNQFGDPHNGPRDTSVTATFDYVGGPDPEPYWSTFLQTTITPDGPNVVDLQMIPVCESSSVSGIVVNAATLEPLEGVEVLGGGRRTFTDAQGRYELLDIRPARDNEPRTTTIFARKAGFFDASIDVTTYCGAQLIVDFGTPFGGFGIVAGTVTDSDSGDPIADVFIGSTWGDSTTTAADGTYSFDRAPLTSDGEPRDWTISATRGFDQLQQVVTVSADAPAVADFQFGVENLPPTAIGQNLGTDTETALPITLTGNDPEGAGLTFTIVDDPTLGTLGGTAPDLTYTPSGAAGDDSFTFTVSDGEHVSDPATISIEVTEVVNGPPVISAPATVEVPAGEAREIGVSAADPDDDPLELSLTDDGGGRASIDDQGDGTAVITVDTELADAGQSVDIGVAVTDGELGDGATITVTIVAGQEPVNRPPEVVIDAPDEVDEGTRVVFDASGTTDPDGDAMTFAWTLVDFDGSPIITGSGPSFSHEFDDDFLGAAHLVVTDARGETAEAEAEILVHNVLPVVEVDIGEAPVEVATGESLALTGSFTDPGDDTHQLVVDWGDGMTEAVEHDSGDFAASHTYAVAGTFTVVVEVCDDDEGCGNAGDTATVVAAGSSSPATTTTTTTTVASVVTLPPTGSGGSTQVLLALGLLVLGLGLLTFSRLRRT